MLKVNGQRGPNLSICLAVAPDLGLISYKLVIGGFKNSDFVDFVSEIDQLVQEPVVEDGQFVMLVDNARAHMNYPELSDGHSIRFLPPYSPFMNVAEYAGSCLTSHVKRVLATPALRDELRDVANLEPHESLHGFRLRVLKRVVEENLNQITSAKCVQWSNHVMTYFNRCLNHEDIYE